MLGKRLKVWFIISAQVILEIDSPSPLFDCSTSISQVTPTQMQFLLPLRKPWRCVRFILLSSFIICFSFFFMAKLNSQLKGNAGSKRQHVHGCSLVRARKFYGYHSSEELFVKINLYPYVFFSNFIYFF